jgi:hypothetical protein
VPLLSVAAPTLGQWHQVVYVFDGATHRLYLDGRLADTSTLPADADRPDTLVVGRTGAHWREYFPGFVDDLRIYDRGLGPEDIAALFTRPADLP